MGRYITFLISIFLFLAVPGVNASIQSWSCADDGDGAIVMTSPTLTDNGSGNYGFSMDCTQYWFPGHLQGDFTTDESDDPTVGIIEDISNDTDFDWTDYHITIGMTQNFSILNTGLVMPNGWTSSIVAPVAGTNNDYIARVGCDICYTEEKVNIATTLSK